MKSKGCQTESSEGQQRRDRDT